MKSNFNDSNIIIRYIQQMISESYNSYAKINSEYYETFDMNYGFAHYIAKYLDYMYPILDPITRSEYNNISEGTIRNIRQPISVMNYFLCDNQGNRLRYSPYFKDANGNPIFVDSNNFSELYKKQRYPYNKIYNQYMVVYYDSENDKLQPYMGNYFNYKDTPLFITYDKIDNLGHYNYFVDDNVIFTFSEWANDKQICEIDNFIGSYLLGRTIGPRSSMEDIYYAQRLLIRNRNIEQFEKGIWCPKTDPYGNSCEGTIYDMTQTVMNYQRSIVENSITNNYNIFVTGYFDIFTEAYAVKEVGVRSNGILGL